MNKLTKWIGMTLLISGGMYGCATIQPLTQEQVFQQYPAILDLEKAVQDAKAARFDLLAPEGLKTAELQLSDAYTAARKGIAQTARVSANEGLSAIEKARNDAGTNSDILAEVLEARERATKAGAETLYREQLADLDAELARTATLVEMGNLEKAKQRRPDLSKQYSNLELQTLEEGTVARAEAAINQARAQNAHKLAPKTFTTAEESLALAISILEADRAETQKAEAAAQRAVIQAGRSEQIGELIRDFERRNFRQEDIVLWYQGQLAMIAAPLNKGLTFTEENKQTVTALRQDIAALVDDRTKLAEATTIIDQLREQHRQEVAELETQFAQEMTATKQQLAGEQLELTLAQQEREERFNRIRALFSEEEATVYRQGDNVLISAHGFKFPVGSSEIQPQNFGLMDKIIEAVHVFDRPHVDITGHTDNTGSDETNQKLSTLRAESVTKFMHDVGHISAEHIKARGFGESKPVASNSTPEGRALNRRIDVLVINE